MTARGGTRMAARNPGSAVEGKVLGRPGGEPGPPRAYTVRRMAAARTFQADKAKTPISFETGVLGMVSLTMSYFHWKYNQLSSAIRCFTVLFGMGRGGTTSLWSSGKGFAARAANSLLGQKQS